jgi:hypothetical protein
MPLQMILPCKAGSRILAVRTRTLERAIPSVCAADMTPEVFRVLKTFLAVKTLILLLFLHQRFIVSFEMLAEMQVSQIS